MFSKIGVPQNGWFIMENRIRMDDLAVFLCIHPRIDIEINWICYACAMVVVNPRNGVMGPFINALFMVLNRGDPNHLQVLG